MIKVVHWVNITRLFRCHSTFKDTKQITNYYLVYPITRYKQMFIRKNMRVGNVRQILFLRESLSEINPDVIICANIIDREIMEVVREYCTYFIYIQHSIWSDDIINSKYEDPEFIQHFDLFDQIYCNHKEYKLFTDLGIPNHKIKRVNGITYLDEVMARDLTQTKNKIFNLFIKNPQIKKTILFIHNTGFACRNLDDSKKINQESSHDYYIILNEIINYATEHNYHVFSKIKKKSMDLYEDRRIRKLHRSPFLTVI